MEGPTIKTLGSLFPWKGRMIKLCTTGELGSYIGRDPLTIRLWERKGILPKPLFSTKRKMRLYTENQVIGIKRLIQELGVKKGVKIPESFSKRLKTLFTMSALEAFIKRKEEK